MNSKITDSFLQGGGEMGERIRNYPWENTVLGTPKDWPQNLRSILDIILHSKFPMFIWWGKDLIQFYNDAYRPSFGNNGKHPNALGQRGEECWPEIWPSIKPLIDQVLNLGEATWNEDQLIPIYRNNKLEDVYWTFGYSPIKNEDGRPEGVLVICTETTQAVLARQRIVKREQSLRNTILQAPVAMCIFRGRQHVVEIANERMFEIWGKSSEAVTGKPIFEGLPEAKGQGFEALLSNVYNTGKTYKAYEVPAKLPRNGSLEQVYLDLVYEAFREANGDICGVMAIATEVTDYVMIRKDIEEAEERARIAIESADLGTYEVNLLTDEIKTSDRFNEIWGERYISGSEYVARIHKHDRANRDKAHEESKLSGKIYYEARVIRQDGSIRWVKVNGKILYDVNRKPTVLLGVVQDITEQKELELRKDDFISMVSHELKTPLTSLKGYTYLLNEKFRSSHDGESMSMLLKMNNQVNRLNYIIQDLLDVTRIEGNKIRFREDTFDFSELVIQTVEEVQDANKTHRIVIESNRPAIIFADKERMSQVLTNLLNNAVRYSPHSSTVIVSSSLQNNEIVCSIKDFGKGIAKDNQSKIFERFYQVSDVTRLNAGLGLGLYISAQIIERQDGKIWVESEPGKGSTFYFSLPVKKGTLA